MKWTKFEYAYRDSKGREHHMTLETLASYSEARRSFTFDCKANGWEFLYFRRLQ